MTRIFLLTVLLLAVMSATAQQAGVEGTVSQLRSGEAGVTLGQDADVASIEPGDRVEFSTTMDGLRVAAGSGVVSEIGDDFVWIEEVDSRVTLGMTARIQTRTEPARDLVSEAAEAPAAPPGEDVLPAEDVLSRLLRRHHEAMGGEAWEEVETLRVSGEMTTAGSTTRFRHTWKRPDRFCEELFARETPGNVLSRKDASYITAYIDGKGRQAKILEIGPSDRRVEMSGPFDEELEYPWLDPSYRLGEPFSHWRSMGFEITFEGRGLLAGVPAYHVRVRGDVDGELSYFIDAETYRLAETLVRSRGVETARRYDDYDTVEGLLIPRSVTRDVVLRDLTLRRDYTIRRVEVDVEVDDSFFRRP